MCNIAKKIVTLIMAAVMLVAFLPAMPQAQAMAKAKAPARVKITKAEAKGNSLYIKWKKTKGAKKYQIFIKEGKSKKFKRYATVKKPQTFRIKNLKWRTRYQVKMRAVNGKKKGKWSATYQYKFGKKKTLQQIAMSQKEIEGIEELERLLENEVSGLFDARIGFSGNNMFINMNSLYPFTDAETAELSDRFAKEFESTAFKKDMKKTINNMENISGLSGIKIVFSFKNYDGSTIYSRMYS